jgi:ABC-type glycerol-3-phosphate transport system substrate-binding protein
MLKAESLSTDKFYNGKKSITACTFYPEILQGMRAVTADFKKETGITVNVQSVPYELYEMWLQSRFLAGQPPEIMVLEKKDLFWHYGQNKKVLNFDNIIKKANLFDEQKRPWKELFHNLTINQLEDPGGHLYMLPFTQYGTGYFYNKQIYAAAQAEPPCTWTEMIATFTKIKQKGLPAHASTFKNDYITLIWVADRLLNCFFRTRIPEINLIKNSDIKFDAYNPESVIDEKIDLSEKIVAFERGIIDPGVSPEYRETIKMLYDYAMTWNDNFMAAKGADVYYKFAKGNAASIYNGTWYFSMLDNFQNLIREIEPKNAFDYGIFLFPKLTKKCSKFAKAGNIDQNSAVRSFLAIPKQQEKWKEDAAILFAQYITSKGAQRLFEKSKTFDLPAMRGASPRSESIPLLTQQKYASLTVTEMQGFDSQSLSETIVTTQMFFMDKTDINEYLKQLSSIHRRSLLRLSKIYYKQLNHEFIRKETGCDFK